MNWNDLLNGMKGKWSTGRRRGLDPEAWEAEVAFIRLDFPAEQRDAAQHYAAVLACIVGKEICRLRPDHRIVDILQWGKSDSLDAVELVMMTEEEFRLKLDEKTTFRDLVESATNSVRTP